jgi:hypothetical protein
MDLRLSKLLRFGGKRTSLKRGHLQRIEQQRGVLSENANFAAWRQPKRDSCSPGSSRLGLQFDF